MIKDGKAIVTTSKEAINNTLNNTGFMVDADTKNSILNNNYSIQLDSKKLFEILGNEASTTPNKKMAAYMKDNMGNITTESSYKNGMIQGTTTIAIKGNHANSLEFIFNTIETINKLMEEDRLEKTKKVD
jgi:transcriptional regulator of heat shock response